MLLLFEKTNSINYLIFIVVVHEIIRSAELVVPQFDYVAFSDLKTLTRLQ